MQTKATLLAVTIALLFNLASSSTAIERCPQTITLSSRSTDPQSYHVVYVQAVKATGTQFTGSVLCHYWKSDCFRSASGCPDSIATFRVTAGQSIPRQFTHGDPKPNKVRLDIVYGGRQGVPFRNVRDTTTTVHQWEAPESPSDGVVSCWLYHINRGIWENIERATCNFRVPNPNAGLSGESAELVSYRGKSLNCGQQARASLRPIGQRVAFRNGAVSSDRPFRLGNLRRNNNVVTRQKWRFQNSK